MNKKYCIGCGIELQDHNMNFDGYTTNINNDICQRCFRLKNYGEYQVVTKSNEDYLNILKIVNQTKDLVLFIVDLLNIDKDLNYINEYLKNNKIILVLNKRDVLPKSVNEEKIIAYIKNLNLNFIDIIVISCEKNYNIDLLLTKIKKYQTSHKVYVVGHTNAGKSSLINKLIKNYSENTQELTISPLPSTTLNKIEIVINKNLTLVDTPGLIDRANIINYVTPDFVKKINAKKEIKPRTFQISPKQAILVNDLLRIDCLNGEKNSFTFYMANNLKIKKVNIKNETLKSDFKREMHILNNQDLVINGLGFVKIVWECDTNIYINPNVEVFVRDAII